MGLWARIVIIVVLASLDLPRWTSPRTTATVFWLPRGTLLVMGATTLLQYTPAPSVLSYTSVQTGRMEKDFKVWGRIVFLMALASLVVQRWFLREHGHRFQASAARGVMPRWISLRTTDTVFRLPRGTLLVIGGTAMVQLIPALGYSLRSSRKLDYVEMTS